MGFFLNFDLFPKIISFSAHLKDMDVWNKVCRACLSTKESFIYFLNENVSPEVYLFCTSIEVHKDEELPKALCNTCHELIRKYSEFKQTCIQSQNSLVNYCKTAKEPFLQLEDAAVVLGGVSQNNEEPKHEFDVPLKEEDVCDLNNDELLVPVKFSDVTIEKNVIVHKSRHRERGECTRGPYRPIAVSQTMPRENNSMSRKRKRPKCLVSMPSPRPQKWCKNLIDQEISVMLRTESDDNCSDFDDDIGDPDFVLQSNHNTESEQSEDDEDQITNPQGEEVHRQAIRPDHEVEENRSKIGDAISQGSNRQNEEKAKNEQIREEHCNEEEDRSNQVRERRNERLINDEQPNEESMTEHPPYYYGKNRYKWSSVEPSRTTQVCMLNVVNAPQQVSPTEFTSIEELWKLLFTEDMIDMIVRHTNGKLNNYRTKFKDIGRSELGPTNRTELKALIGLLFYASVFCSSHENADFIFATDGTGREIFRCVMSKNRFSVLVNCLRFDDAATRTERLKNDNLAAISDLFNAFINNCQQNYTLGTHVCIDEMLVGFRGHCKFKIYIPNKPNKYGLKVLLLVDAQTFYVYNAYIYHGTGSDSIGLTDAEKRFTIPTQSVIRLSKGIEGSNRNITADNWFTSIELLQALKDRGLTYLGTVKKNKKEIPPEFQPNKDRIVGSSLYGFTKDYTMVSYVTKPRKAVILVSSMHHSKETVVVTNKPVMINDYNKTKGGVDEVDKKCSNYSCSRRTQRWPMILFYRLLDLSGVNAYVLYNKCRNKENIRRGHFILSLARELVLPEMKLRVYNDRMPRELRLTMERIIGPIDMPPKNNTNPDPGTRKTCAICPSRLKRRTKYFCYQCKKPMCLTCCFQVCSDCKLRES